MSEITGITFEPDRVAAFAGVLLEHAKECTSERCATCDCGWDHGAYEEGYSRGNEAHVRHVARALLASPAMGALLADESDRERAGLLHEAKAEALRAAADELEHPMRPKIVRHDGDGPLLTGSRFIAAWLRSRANEATR